MEMLDPFRKVTLDWTRLGVEDPERLIATAAVAVGLALRKAGDR